MKLDRELLQKYYDEAPEGESGDVVRSIANALIRVETFLDEQADYAATMADQALTQATMAGVCAESGSIMGTAVAETKEMAAAILGQKPIEIIEGDGVHFSLKNTYWAMRVIGTSILRSMKKTDGSYANAVEIRVTIPDLGDVLITGQRKSGKTPIELFREQEERAKVAEYKLHILGENLGNVVAKMAHQEGLHLVPNLQALIAEAKQLLGRFA